MKRQLFLLCLALVSAMAQDRPSMPLGEGRKKVGQIRANPRDGQRYVWIAPGTFQMGCSPGDTKCDPGEKPAHPVTITRGFWMGQTEVTVAAYRRFAAATSRGMPVAPVFNAGWGRENQPLVN